MTTLRYGGPVPVYQQIAAIIRGRIEAGELRPGDTLPSESTLMQEFEVARGTARQATRVLVAEGLAIIVPGRGAYVAEPESEGG